MAEKKRQQDIRQDAETEEVGMPDFPIDAQRDIVDIITDSPSIVSLGGKEYQVKNLRMYSISRIMQLCLRMKQANSLAVDDDNKLITALCTDLDAMCEVMAIILCNHLFTAEGAMTDLEGKSRNEHYISVMKSRVLNSTYEPNEWAAIVLGAIKSIDLSAFFLLKKSVSTLTDSMLTRKKKSEETALQFMAAQSLRTQRTS